MRVSCAARFCSKGRGYLQLLALKSSVCHGAVPYPGENRGRSPRSGTEGQTPEGKCTSRYRSCAAAHSRLCIQTGELVALKKIPLRKLEDGIPNSVLRYRRPCIDICSYALWNI